MRVEAESAATGKVSSLPGTKEEMEQSTGVSPEFTGLGKGSSLTYLDRAEGK